MQRVEVCGKRERNWALPAALALAVLAAGWWFGGDLARGLIGKATELTLLKLKWPAPTVPSRPAVSSRLGAGPRKIRSELPESKISRRATLREFMQRDLKLSPSQIRLYEQYRRYYENQIRWANRIETRNRSGEPAKLAYERERILVALLGQRSMDSIRWWAMGSKSGISLGDWLRQRETRRQRSAYERGIASR
jgi:hypothetical protein